MTQGELLLKLLVAPSNPGNLREYAERLTDLGFDENTIKWVLLSDVGITLDVDETGATFEENARLKAATYAGLSGLVTLADDSGLVVDALGGAPGIMSARYAGPAATDEDRYQKLLRELADVPEENRTARFTCAVAVTIPNGETIVAEGSCEGVINYGPMGDNGFGYDPVFYIPGLEQTMAQLAPELKNRISHRAVAREKLKPTLRDLLSYIAKD